MQTRQYGIKIITASDGRYEGGHRSLKVLKFFVLIFKAWNFEKCLDFFPTNLWPSRGM